LPPKRQMIDFECLIFNSNRWLSIAIVAA